MNNSRKFLALFLLIILEGYVVLSTELLAIRQSIPFSGSGTEAVSVIIAAVLMPLAFGYYYGGRFKPRPGFGIKKKLISNILISMIILLPGMSYVMMAEMHEFALHVGIKHRLAQVSLYSLIFLVTPVYLLGQTIPLVSNYFGRERLARATGRILFFSTIGSFAGAVFSTLVLMSHIGVNNTVSLNFVILSGLVIMLAGRRLAGLSVLSVVIAIAALVLNSNPSQYALSNIIQHNLYNSIAIKETGSANHLYLNNSASSMYQKVSGRKYPYIEMAERWALDPIRDDKEKRDILVIGAGAFTFGYEDTFHNYDFVDIDKNLKDVAEEHILPGPLTENKKFHPLPGRAFLAQTDKKYDVILLDTYFGKVSLPEDMITADFFADVKAHMKEGGVLVTNFVASPNFKNAFSRNLDNTMRAVFPYISRVVAREDYAPWNKDEKKIRNVLYIYVHQDSYEDEAIYTDNLNRSFLDRP